MVVGGNLDVILALGCINVTTRVKTQMSVISATFAEAFGERVYDDGLPTFDENRNIPGGFLRRVDDRVQELARAERHMLRRVWNCTVTWHRLNASASSSRRLSAEELSWALANGLVKFLLRGTKDYSAITQQVYVSYVLPGEATIEDESGEARHIAIAVQAEELLRRSMRRLPEFAFLHPESSRAATETELRFYADALARSTGFTFMVFTPSNIQGVYSRDGVRDEPVLTDFNVPAYFSELGRLIPLLDPIPTLSDEEIKERHFVARQIVFKSGVVREAMEDTLRSFDVTLLAFNDFNEATLTRALDVFLLCSVRGRDRDVFTVRRMYPDFSAANADPFTLLSDDNWTKIYGELDLRGFDATARGAKKRLRERLESEVKETLLYGIATSAPEDLF